MTRSDIIALLTQVAGFCGLAISAGFGSAIDSVFPGYGAKTLAILGLVGIVTGTVVRVLANPSPPQGTQAVLVASNTVPAPENLTTQQQATKA